MAFQYHLKELIERKKLLEGRKITQMEIARDVGVAQSVISNLINNKPIHLTTKVIVALCEYFDCSIDDLISLQFDYTKSLRHTRLGEEEGNTFEAIYIQLQGMRDKKIVKNPQAFLSHNLSISKGAYLFLNKPIIKSGTYAYVKIKDKWEIRELKLVKGIIWLISPFSDEPTIIYDSAQIWIEGTICMFLHFTAEMNILLEPKKAKS